MIDVHLMQSSQSDDLSKSITEHMEKQRYALSMSEENKVGIKNEVKLKYLKTYSWKMSKKECKIY